MVPQEFLMTKILFLLPYANSAAATEADEMMERWLANNDAVFELLVRMSDTPENLNDLHDLATAVTEYPRDEALELLAVAWIETRYTGRRSQAGACCWTGMLGGRYDNPSCEILEACASICLRYTSTELEYWRRHCGKAYLDAYNGGWRKCWTSESRKRCTSECESYSSRVRHLERLLDRRLTEGGIDQWIT